MSIFEHELQLIHETTTVRVTGRVREVTGLTVVAEGLPLAIGSICRIEPPAGAGMDAQVVGFVGSRTLLMPLADPLGVRAGDPVTSEPAMQQVPVGPKMLGRVLDGLGRPIDGFGAYPIESRYPVYGNPPSPLTRQPIDVPLPTGIRSIDLMTTIGGGQRIGVFAGTGVGKSVLMGMIARNTRADVVVAALVGERGREVGDFIRKDLGEQGRQRSVLVVSTSDESPVKRVRACFVATAVAEYFRDRGNDVLLMMDSVTRLAMAQRQIGLASGEPPATKGYPPSVFALLPRLLERSGRTASGSITGLYTVLVEGDDISEPVSDTVRGILDGHVWLSRELANRGHYPAVAVLESISRVMPDLVSREHADAVANVKRVLANWAEIEDLINIGAYAAGSNPEIDLAVRMKPRIDELLQQRMDEPARMEESIDALLALNEEMGELRQKLTARKPAALAV